jgi:hypothetical protein
LFLSFLSAEESNSQNQASTTPNSVLGFEPSPAYQSVAAGKFKLGTAEESPSPAYLRAGSSDPPLPISATLLTGDHSNTLD